MTEAKTITIVLEKGVSMEYVEERLIPAIQLMAGVLSATAEEIEMNDYWELDRAKTELRRKLFEVLK